tara:strand:+ start:34255 stop:35838 length:1584 start_codon:yes stop_codon:yes gene_type:complete
MKESIVLILSIVLLCSCHNQKETKHTYSNPVIAGEIPDPSIIRVGKTYYATGTSFDFAPNYPIYESFDLINWKQIGTVFSEPPSWSSDDFWAPELFYNDDTFFVYYTTKRKDTKVACIGVASTKDIYKGFTDHGIIIEWGEEAIDGFVFKDEDDKLYITWKAYGLTDGRDVEILASELSADGLKLVGNHFTLTDYSEGWIGAGDEGQCLFKRNGFYYLMYSIGGCCDNKCDYRVKIARSKYLKSGWEQYPDPILKGGTEWVCTGHGTLVETNDNSYYYLYHAYNSKDFEYVGRQGLLDELVWNEDTNWPYFKNGDTPSVEAKTPFPNTVQHHDSVFKQDFSNQKEQVIWEWDLNYPSPKWHVENGNLNITAQDSSSSFLGIRPQKGDYSFEVELISGSGLSGIGVYSNRQYHIALAASDSEIQLYKVENGIKEILFQKSIKDTKTIHLKYSSISGRFLQFFWSENGKDWMPLKVNDENKIDASFVAQWGYSPRIGFIVQGDTSMRHQYKNIKVEYDFSLKEKIISSL